MHFFSVPSTIQRLISSCTWRKEGQGKVIFLTFDDGPHPEITPWVMDLLAPNQIKATFFCVGENLSKYPDVAKKLLTSGHRIGNHTMHHIKGWRNRNSDYMMDIENCENEIQKIQLQLDQEAEEVKQHDAGTEIINVQSNIAGPKSTSKRENRKLFRPPYGQIKPSQIKLTKSMGYEVVQWSDLSCDYDKHLDCGQSLSALVKNAKPGSIVVFHDSEKAENQLKLILPKYLEAMMAAGFTFETL